jgi:cyclopropane fatty-acyl-phospholipid synthase-like methyltransferase
VERSPQSLAREFGVEIWAADLWIEPTENAAHIDEAGLTGKVIPLTAEANRLPFAHGFFDAVVSIDAYHYFGTEILYLSYLAQFVKPDGRIGIVAPANAIDLDDPDAIELPDDLSDEFGADWFTFRNADWWRRHWSRTCCVEVETPEMIEGRARDLAAILAGPSVSASSWHGATNGQV